MRLLLPVKQHQGGNLLSIKGFYLLCTLMEKAGKRHFQTFDALRFFAFLKVFLLHLPIFIFPWFNFIKAGGGIGVQFFFVLSGFLISYIILQEKQSEGRLNLKHFFGRRILRIWPLYYLMILVAYSTPVIFNYLHLYSSSSGYAPNIWMSVSFLENYKMMFTHQSPNGSPLPVMWSLCIEEHFYIIWGLLLYFISVKHLPKLIMACLIIAPTARFIFLQYNIPTLDITTNIDLFAFGAIPAWLLISYPLYAQKKINSIPLWAQSIYVLIVLAAVLACSQTNSDEAYICLTSVLGALFAGLILLVSPVGARLKISDKNILSRLGIYTYGLYLYHTLVINLLVRVFEKINYSTSNTSGAIVLMATSLAGTIFISLLSYYFFEKYFLKLKQYLR